MHPDEAMGYAALGIIFLLAFAVYLLPAIVAFARQHPNRWLILALNAFLGGTGLIWVVCLIWACKALHLSPKPDGTHGGESGFNLHANDVQRVRLVDAPTRPEPSNSSVLEKLERLKVLRDEGTIDAQQFDRMRQHIIG